MGLLAWPGRTVRSSNGSTLGAHLHDTCDDMEKHVIRLHRPACCLPCFPRSPDRNKAPQMQFADVLSVKPRHARRLRSMSGAAYPESKVAYHDDSSNQVKVFFDLFFGSRYARRIYDLACLPSRRPRLPPRRQLDQGVT